MTHETNITTGTKNGARPSDPSLTLHLDQFLGGRSSYPLGQQGQPVGKGRSFPYNLRACRAAAATIVRRNKNGTRATETLGLRLGCENRT